MPATGEPHDRVERAARRQGYDVIVGLDEVGRGAWAGPVSVGVAVMPQRRRPPLTLRDSKLLSESQREALFPEVVEWCAGWAVGHAEPVECDRLGMTAALGLAAKRALGALGIRPSVVLLDGSFDYLSTPPAAVDPEALDDGSEVRDPLRVQTVVKGDRRCVSIAAASIVAKVTRDRLMHAISPSFPAYDFDRNKGYPSPVHRTALAGFGLTSVHRRTWSYVEGLAFR